MSTPPKRDLHLKITDKIQLEDLNFLDEINFYQNKDVTGKNPSVGQEYAPDSTQPFNLLRFETDQSNNYNGSNAESQMEFDQNVVVTENNPSDHIPVGREYPSNSTQPFELLRFGTDPSNNLNGQNAKSNIEFDQNMVVAENNPSEHIPVGREYPSDSTQPFDLLRFGTDPSNNLNGQNAKSNIEFDQNMVVTENNPSEHIPVGREYPSDSIQPFELLRFGTDPLNNLNEQNAKSNIEFDQNMVVTENNPSEHIPVGREYPSDSTQPFDLLRFGTDPSNNLNGQNAQLNIEFDQNMVVTENNPSEHIPVGREYPSDSIQPFELLRFGTDPLNNLNEQNAKSNIEFDQNMVVTENNPSEHIPVGREYPSDSIQPFELLRFGTDPSNNLNGQNAKSNIEFDQNMVVAENNPSEHIPVGREYPSDSIQPFELLRFGTDPSNNLNGQNAKSNIEFDQNMVVAENNPSEHIPVGREYPSDSTEPFDLLHFETDQSKNLNEPNAQQNVESNSESFESLTVSDSDLNGSSRGFTPVHDQIPDTNFFVENTDSNTVYQTPDEHDWSTTQIQPISTQNYDEPMEMNFVNFQNPQTYVQPNYFVQQQPPLDTQPGPSTYPDLKFLQVSNNNVLVLCKKEDLTEAQPLATNFLVKMESSDAPILHQIQDPRYIWNQTALQSNIPNAANYNPLQSIQMSGIPGRFLAIPNGPTQRMGFNGANPWANSHISVTPRDFYRRIGPRGKMNLPAFQPLYNFRLPARNAAELASQQTTELALTTKKKEISDELSEYNNKRKFYQSCRCTKSQCLKLYCECFVGSVFCQKSCKCKNCFNNLEHEEKRSEVLKSILVRNPDAFKRKIDKSGSEHKVGCNCRLSHCLKNYCECFSANIPCSGNCKCMQCQNRSTDDDLNGDKPMKIADDVPKPKEGNSSNSSNSNGKTEKKRPVEFFDLLTDKVLAALWDSMLLKGLKCSGNETDQLISVMEEFSSCFNEIRAAYYQIVAKNDKNEKRVKNTKKKPRKD